MGRKKTEEDVKLELIKLGYFWIEELNNYKKTTTSLILVNSEGYIVKGNFHNIARGYTPLPFSPSNPFVLCNIKKFIRDNDIKIKLISTKYIRNNKSLDFICLNENHSDEDNRHFKLTWNKLKDRKSNGCKICSRRHSDEERKLGLLYIKEKIKTINSDIKINSTEYVSAKTPLECECLICGHEWNPTWNDITNNRGCPVCAKSKKGWNLNSWRLQSHSSNLFDSFKVYIIRCIDKNKIERDFYKIGRTFMTINRRLSKSNFPYEFDILKIIEDDSIELIFNLENKLQSEHRKNGLKYIPKIKFAGDSECFSQLLSIEEIDKIIENLRKEVSIES